MALYYFNSISIVFKCLKHRSKRCSNCHYPVHRCIIITVSNQSTTNLLLSHWHFTRTHLMCGGTLKWQFYYKCSPDSNS